MNVLAAGRVADASAVRSGAARAEAIRHPSGRDDEQRREKEAEQRVQPNQRDVEAAEAEADPECAKRTMRFQASAPGGCVERRKYSGGDPRYPGDMKRGGGEWPRADSMFRA